MKTKLLVAFLLACFFIDLVAAAEQATQVSDELKVLVTKIQNKLKEHKNTEADLADELKEFDALLDKHKDEKTDDVAQVLLMKATLYFEVLDDTAKASELVKQLKNDFPQTK